jgi:polysaccharide export outer membrane protein
MKGEAVIRRTSLGLVGLILLHSTGCLSGPAKPLNPSNVPAACLGSPTQAVPTELDMINLPPYVIGQSDVLIIEAYTEPKNDGQDPVRLGVQPISGQHLVRPDGTVNLGVWGLVPVNGLTTTQAQEAIKKHLIERAKTDPILKKYIVVNDPEKLIVVVDVAVYNSRAYYVITDGAGFGEQIYRFPYQGYETVIDALANIGGLPQVGSKKDMWIARRSPHPNMPDQILPIDYVALTQHGATNTGYQIFPGDRLYVRADTSFRVDGFLQKMLTPIERLLGLGLLGGSAYNQISGRGLAGNNNLR